MLVMLVTVSGVAVPRGGAPPEGGGVVIRADAVLNGLPGAVRAIFAEKMFEGSTPPGAAHHDVI